MEVNRCRFTALIQTVDGQGTQERRPPVQICGILTCTKIRSGAHQSRVDLPPMDCPAMRNVISDGARIIEYTASRVN